MGVLGTILLVVFIIISVLLVLLVLVQNEDSNGMGGVFGGQTAAFGAHSASVLSKTTGVLVALFFVIAFTLAVLNKAPAKDAGLTDTVIEMQGSSDSTATSSSSWIEESTEETVESGAEIQDAE